MKIIALFLVAGLLATTCKAQDIPDRNAYNAGKELKAQAESYYTGTTFLVIGSGFMGLGAFKSDTKPTDKKILFIVGGSLATIGTIIQIASFTHTIKAGDFLMGRRKATTSIQLSPGSAALCVKF